MAMLQFMGILGVRSFSPDEASYIKFSSPCTVIVGQNGSGKTTIVEALKYACTGDMPPNSRQGAFIHDVKAAKRDSIKAQIKLKIIAKDGTPLVCSRSVVLSQKKTNVVMKTLESKIESTNLNTGEMTVKDSRSEDINQLMSYYLGASRAMMDIVIFCHQEESNWPFAESSALKKRFDALFDSEKHEKFIKQHKDTKKSFKDENQVNRIRLEGLKVARAQAERLQSLFQSLYSDLIEKQRRLALVENNREALENTLLSDHQLYQSKKKAHDDFLKLVQDRNTMMESMAELSQYLVERTESDEALQELLETYSIDANVYQQTKETSYQTKTTLQQSLTMKKTNISEIMTTISRLQASQETYEERMKEREKSIQSANQEFGLGLSSFGSEQAIHALRQLVNHWQKTLKDTKINAREEESAKMDSLQALRSEQAALQYSLNSATSQKESCTSKVEQLYNQLKAMQESVSILESLKRDLHEKENALSFMSSQLDSNDMRAKVKKSEEELIDLGKQIEALNKEIAIQSQSKDAKSKLSHHQSSREKRLKLANAIYEANLSGYEKYLGYIPHQDLVEKELQEALSNKQHILQSTVRTQDTTQQRLLSLDDSVSTTKKRILGAEAEMKAIEEQIKYICKDASFSDQVDALDNALLELERELAVCKYKEEFYTHQHQAINQNGTCNVCKSIIKQDGVDSIAESMRSLWRSQQERQCEIEKSIKEHKEKQEKMNSIRGLSYQLKFIQKDTLPSLQNDLDSSYHEREFIQEEINFIKANQQELEAHVEQLKFLSRQSENRIQHLEEAGRIQEEILQLENELKSTSSLRTVHHCQQELQQVSELEKATRNSIIQMMQDEASARDKQRLAEADMRSAKEAVDNIERSMYQQQQVTNEIERLEKEITKCSALITEKDAKLATLAISIQEASSDLQKYQEASLQKQEQAQAQTIKSSQSLNFIEGLTQDISRYQVNDLQGELNRLLTLKESTNQEIENISESLYKTEHYLRTLEEEMMSRISTKRDLESQLQLRRMHRELVACNEHLSTVNEPQLNLEQGQLQQKIQQNEKQKAKFSEECATIRGAISQVEQQMHECQKDLNNNYKNVPEEHAKLQERVSATDLLITNIEKTVVELEKSITQTHEDQIENLNNKMKELWMNTYRGGDIDHIALRTDKDKGTTGPSYNYRVVMSKDGKEINMRGRFSAGQKVLASIIVRLALAEIFCLDCSILSLDEPTTNLDKENSRSLAEALVELIKGRSKQKNFQLILITHDEEFVEILARSGLIQVCHRVAKNSR